MLLVEIALGMVLVMALATWRSVRGRRLFAALVLAWAGYAVYEILMVRRVLCSGECNIRVDLLLIYPGLIGATVWACGSAAWRLSRRRLTRADEASPS